jgi:hypothetical protein
LLLAIGQQGMLEFLLHLVELHHGQFRRLSLLL